MLPMVLIFTRDDPIRGKKWEPSIGKLRKSITETNHYTSKEKNITPSVTLMHYLKNTHFLYCDQFSFIYFF